MAKSSKAELNQRVKEVMNILLEGGERGFILQYSSGIWDVSERQADNYIRLANELIIKSVKRDINVDYAKAVRRYERLYLLAVAKEDYRTATSINKELTALQGLLKTQVEHSGSVQFISNIPD